MSDVGGVAADRLRSLIERIERLESEKADLANDIKEVYAEAKSSGFNVPTMRQIVKLRKMDAADRQEQESLLNLYKQALGMLADTPLGRSAIDRAAVSPSVQKAAQKLRDTCPDGMRMSIIAGGKEAVIADKRHSAAE